MSMTRCLPQASLGFSWQTAAQQAGQDWLNFSASYVRDQDLPLLLSSAHILSHLSSKETLDEAELREESFSMEMLQRAVRKMYIPPAALGSKRATAAHKFHCLVHALRFGVSYLGRRQPGAPAAPVNHCRLGS